MKLKNLNILNMIDGKTRKPNIKRAAGLNIWGAILGAIFCLFSFFPASARATVVWSHDVAEPHSRVVIADINWDGYDDVVILNNAEGVTVLSGFDGSTELWSYQISTAGRYRRGLSTINDLDGDGIKDIIVILGTSGNGYGENHNDDELYAISGAVAPPGERVLWGGPVHIGCGLASPIILPDVNGDGKEDIFANTSTPTCSGSGDAGYHFSGADGSLFWNFVIYAEGAIWDIYGRVASPDLDGDGIADIIVCGAGGGGGVEAWKGGAAKGQIWRSLTYEWALNPAIIADVTGDGIPEVAVSSGPTPFKLKVLDGADGSLVWDEVFGNAVYITGDLGDVNEDGYADLAVGTYYFSGWSQGTEYKVHAVSGDPAAASRILWSYDMVEKNSYVKAVDDINGDGRKDVMVWGAMNKVMALSGSDGSVIWEEPFSAGTGGIQVGEFNGTPGQEFLTSVGTEIFALSTPPAVISGTVYQSGGTTPITGGGWVEAYTGDPCSYNWIASGEIDPINGTYTITGLPTGSYTLKTWTWANYISGWWTSTSTVLDCAGAQAISVTAGGTVPGKDFQLDTGATISGTVFQSGGTTPIAGASVGVEDFNTGQGMGGATTDIDGSYTITGLPASQYRVNAIADGRVRKFWDNTLAHHEATPVNVTFGGTTSDINFSLEPGGTISGQVVTANPGFPLANISVDASRQDGAGGWGVITGQYGTYTFVGLPFGQYRISSPSTGRWGSGDDNYATQYYNGHTDPDSADLVTISSGSPDATAIDFALGLGGTISGHVYKQDGGTTIANLHVYAQDYNTGRWMAGTNTDQFGGYSLVLPSGIYRIGTCANCTDLKYVDEWYDNVLNYNDAVPVQVIAPNDTPNIDFSLAEGGTISGRVTTAGGQPLVNVCVDAVDAKCNGNWRGTRTDVNGDYTIVLPAGTFYVRANPSCDSQSYVTEWWNGGSGTIDCNEAAPVVVTVGQDTPNINFSVEQGATITGVVTSDTYGQGIVGGIEGVQVCASPFTGQSWICTHTQSDGSYTLTGLQPGYNRVQASGAGYITEYYDNSYDYNWATAVWVTTDQTTPNIDFSMGKPGSVSGTVTTSEGQPLANVCVGAYSHQCGSGRIAAAQTDGSGYYTIHNLPPQDYYLKTNASCTSPQHYQREWWNTSGGTIICDQAGAIAVFSDQETSGVDFSLDASQTTYPGPVITSSALFSACSADGSSIRTTFWARISGPSPEDVSSFKATGPSGTFNLGLLQPPFRQFATSYQVNVPSVVADGTYTFVVTDSLGRTATVTRDFTYDPTVPQVDSATMTPVDKSYVETTTPTLTWDPVSGAGAYQPFIFDYDGKAIWYTRETEGTSVTIPEGYLQPDTPYYWHVRVNNYATGQNCHNSDILYFYTGTKGLPDLSRNFALSFTDPDFRANWFGVYSMNLAPWDIDYLDVTGPYGTMYPYNGRNFRFYMPLFYQCWSPGPIPMPDGTYTFELEDKDLNTDIQTHDFTYNPVPTVSEASRSPAPNAYLYGKTTYSWAPVSDTRTLHYKVRIRDYNSQIIWYESPSTTETSWTYPDDLPRAPYGSYKWQVMVTDTTSNNLSFTSLRTITIPPLSQYDYTLPGGTGDPLDYVLFTVPFYMGTGADFLAAMVRAIGPYDYLHWRVFAYDGVRYVEINSPEFASMIMEPGMAFWIITVDNNTIQLDGSLAPQTTYYEKTLRSGWNLFALPWPATNINLGNIAVTDGTNSYWLTSGSNLLTLPYVWGFDRDYILLKDAGDVVEAGKGFWIKVEADPSVTVKLLIPPDNNGGHFPVQPTGVPDCLTQVTNYEKPPPPPGASYEPAPDIKANGKDETVTVSSGTPVSIKIELNPGDNAGQNADWWVAVHTPFTAPFDWYTYTHPAGWQRGIHLATQAPLFEISIPFEVLNMTLPIGAYTFYFAVDNNADGVANATWLDSVDIRVE